MVGLQWPTASRGRPRRHPVPSEAPGAAEAMLARAKWHRISWRQGTKGPLAAEFAAVRVRPAEGAQLRNGRHLPGDEVWLVGEHRASGEHKYYLSNLPAETPLEELAATIKARWVCEQAHQQMKEELGLDHFEGRSWTGLHRHALMTMIAFAFLQHLRLGARGKKQRRLAGPPPQPTLPAVRRMLMERLWRGSARCPRCGCPLDPPLPGKVPGSVNDQSRRRARSAARSRRRAPKAAVGLAHAWPADATLSLGGRRRA